MFDLERTDAPATPLLDLTTAKQHLHVTHALEDSLIELYAAAVESALDGHQGTLGRALISQQWQLTLTAFPCGAIRLPLPPFISVDAFVYTPRDGVETTLTTADYVVRKNLGEAYVEPPQGLAWPTGDMDSVVITFSAGFGDDADDVPAAIRAAALLMLADVYTYRDAKIAAALVTNPTVNALLSPYRVQTW